MKINTVLEGDLELEKRYSPNGFTITITKLDNFGTNINKLRDMKRTIARVTINNEKNIFDIDYVDINDLKFLLIKVIDKYEKLHYKGSEIEVLELGINKRDITTNLISEVIITRDSILNKKSFEFKRGVENTPEKYIL
ncbi:hypothetical protein [uncultured Clostridium sp.]|uniref:hypothetical protein n=1 Tax=uncultured Clostridium sp. TaxID=59620 RepID=UPI002609BB7C|nr:hypothetical protein [uncultured Clostridium sp.]